MEKVKLKKPQLEMEYYINGKPDLSLISTEMLKTIASVLAPKVDKHFEGVTKQGQSKKDSKKLVDSS